MVKQAREKSEDDEQSARPDDVDDDKVVRLEQWAVEGLADG